MTVTEAMELIAFEAHPADENDESDGLWIECTWLNKTPSRDRMYRVLKAIKVIYDSLEGHQTLDRKLCAELFQLGSYIPSMFRHNLFHHNRSGFKDELVALEGFVTSVFEGLWEPWVNLPEFKLEFESETD